MRIAFLFLTTVWFSSIASAQEAVATVAATRYENKEYGFTVTLPKDWTSHPVAEAQQPPSGVIPFLSLKRNTSAATGNTVEINIMSLPLPNNHGVSVGAGETYLESLSRVPALLAQKPTTQLTLNGFPAYAANFSVRGEAQHTTMVAVGVKDRLWIFEATGPARSDADAAADVMRTHVRFPPDWSLPPDEKDTSAQMIRVSQGVLQGSWKKNPAPSYPLASKAAGAKGRVKLCVWFARAGTVDQIWITETVDQNLAAAAVEAVRTWEIRPYLLNGKPTRVETQVTINFELRLPPTSRP